MHMTMSSFYIAETNRESRDCVKVTQFSIVIIFLTLSLVLLGPFTAYMVVAYFPAAIIYISPLMVLLLICKAREQDVKSSREEVFFSFLGELCWRTAMTYVNAF